MAQLQNFFAGLNFRKRMTLAVTAVVVMASLFLLVRWNKDRDFKPLYSELSTEDSAAIAAKLKESGAEYRLRESDAAILVPSANLAELRMQMAAAGIPKSGRIGYELFDRTNLGTTDFTEQVNYHRAVEGEIERSLMAMSEVSQARVHITFPKDSVFSDDKQAAKASVMVKLKTGARLSEQNAAAITQLVSSAVEGLAAESVSVMDMRGNLLIRSHKPGDGSGASDDLLQYKEKQERQVQAKIDSVLDSLLGSAKYRTAVDIDCDLTSGEQSEETFDPDKSVITNSQRNEEGAVGKDTAAAGVPGTQSNLPRPAPVRPATAGGGLVRRTETLSYQTNRSVRRMKLPQGMVKRMSVSVVVDQNLRWQLLGKGAAAHAQRIIEPPSAERLKSIQSIVAAAAGVNATRGDVLTVETQPFESTLTAEPPAGFVPAKPAAPAANKFSPVMLGGIGAGVLVVGLGLFFFMKRKKAAAAAAKKKAELEAAQQAAQLAAANSIEHTEAPAIPSGLKNMLGSTEDIIALSSAPITKTELLTRQVTEQVEKDPASLAKIIRTWLNETLED